MSEPVVNPHGSRRWYANGQLHRDDGPAVEYRSGSKAWYRHGLRHREDGPAVELNDGSKQWWLSGFRHRSDGPAVEHPDGRMEWWVNGIHDRTSDPKDVVAPPIPNSQSADTFLSRNKEKRDLWRKFRHRDVEEVYKRRFFDLFDNRCFRCGLPGHLHIDHHIPRKLGGKLEAGNMVALCRRCNNAKGRIDPEVFYGSRHLSRLTHLLDAQKAILDFEWSWEEYNRDKKAYFASLGVPAEKLERIFGDPDYEGYITSDSEKPVYTVDATDAINATLEKMFRPLITDN